MLALLSRLTCLRLRRAIDWVSDLDVQWFVQSAGAGEEEREGSCEGCEAHVGSKFEMYEVSNACYSFRVLNRTCEA